MRDGNPLAIDLFCGAGGLSQGIKKAGFDIGFAIDSDPDAYFVYTQNNPETVAMWGEIGQVKNFQVLLNKMGISYKDVDIVAGGPPCQGFSVANKKTRGPENGKKQLLEFYRAVKEIHPPLFVMENVVGLLSISGGELLASLKDKFEDRGYTLSQANLDAADFGAPQHRKRMFLVGSLDGKFGFPLPTHGPKGDHDYVNVRDAILGDLPPLNGTTGARVCEYEDDPTSEYQTYLRRTSKRLYDHVTTNNNPTVRRRIGLIGQGDSLVELAKEGKVPKELMITIDHQSVYRRLHPDEPSVTVCHFRKTMLIHPDEDRLLSLREAARLQSFDDGYRFPGLISHMQQVVGNALPPFLSRKVFRRARKHLRAA